MSMIMGFFYVCMYCMYVYMYVRMAPAVRARAVGNVVMGSHAHPVIVVL